MKYSRFIILLSLLMSLLVAGWAFAAGKAPKDVQGEKAQAQWKEAVPQAVFAEKQRMAAFLNDSIGFSGGAGDIGKARYTSDGGKNWAQADTSGG